MKKSNLIQIKKVLNNWIIAENIEWHECRDQLFKIIAEPILIESLMDICNSESATVENISTKVDDEIDGWENAEYYVSDEEMYEPDYLLN